MYFEARGEAVRGQIAVAQVVMNRAFSGFYPNTVCGVVYQNKHRHLACQFTFACDNVADVVREPDMWDRAKKIAKAMLDGQLWLPEVAKSTHYHAYWVHPSWVHEMKKMYKFGVHTFYRPRAWGDGSEAPSWGSQAQTAGNFRKARRGRPQFRRAVRSNRPPLELVIAGLATHHAAHPEDAARLRGVSKDGRMHCDPAFEARRSGEHLRMTAGRSPAPICIAALQRAFFRTCRLAFPCKCIN